MLKCFSCGSMPIEDEVSGLDRGILSVNSAPKLGVLCDVMVLSVEMRNIQLELRAAVSHIKFSRSQTRRECGWADALARDGNVTTCHRRFFERFHHLKNVLRQFTARTMNAPRIENR